jgi:poly [ADP-ribose] polymerase
VATLREGLKMPPTEVSSTSYKYGKGIYFTDCASKAIASSQSVAPLSQKLIAQSQGYVDGYILLCEVALGRMHKVFKNTQLTKPPLGDHSVYAVG